MNQQNPNWKDVTYQARFSFQGAELIGKSIHMLISYGSPEILGFVKGSLKVKNKFDEVKNDETQGTTGERQPKLPNGDFILLYKNDDVNTIDIGYALRSDIKQLQPIEFDIIFTDEIDRSDFHNYDAGLITNETNSTVIKNDELEPFSICLEYEVESFDCTYSQ